MAIVASVRYPDNESSGFSVDIPAELISPAGQTAAHPTMPIQNLLVATKAPDARAAVSSVLHRLDRQYGSNIIILSNGAMAVRDEIERLLENERDGGSNVQSQLLNTKITLASTTHGAYRSTDGDENGHSGHHSIVHAGIGSTFVESQSMANLFEAAGLRATYASPDEMNILLWKKLATNCAINPLTALHKCANGKLAYINEEEIAAMDGVIEEVSQIALMDAAGRGLSDESTKELKYESLSSFVKKVIRDTAGNKSSMLQDVMAGRKTEIHYLNGHVVRIGREHFGHECPFNEEMVKRVEGITCSTIRQSR